MKDLDEVKEYNRNSTQENDVCPDCHGTGRVIGQGGSIRVCVKCLMEGKMDQHTSKIRDAKEFGVKL